MTWHCGHMHCPCYCPCPLLLLIVNPLRLQTQALRWGCQPVWQQQSLRFCSPQPVAMRCRGPMAQCTLQLRACPPPPQRLHGHGPSDFRPLTIVQYPMALHLYQAPWLELP